MCILTEELWGTEGRENGVLSGRSRFDQYAGSSQGMWQKKDSTERVPDDAVPDHQQPCAGKVQDDRTKQKGIFQISNGVSM